MTFAHILTFGEHAQKLCRVLCEHIPTHHLLVALSTLNSAVKDVIACLITMDFLLASNKAYSRGGSRVCGGESRKPVSSARNYDR